MESKKAFTLIELLAVIVILGIILIISVPNINNIMEKSKKQVLKSDALMYIKSAKNKYIMGEASGDDIIEYDISELTDDGKTTKNQDGYVYVRRENNKLIFYITLYDDEYMIGDIYNGNLNLVSEDVLKSGNYNPSQKNPMVSMMTSSFDGKQRYYREMEVICPETIINDDNCTVKYKIKSAFNLGQEVQLYVADSFINFFVIGDNGNDLTLYFNSWNDEITDTMMTNIKNALNDDFNLLYSRPLSCKDVYMFTNENGTVNDNSIFNVFISNGVTCYMDGMYYRLIKQNNKIISEEIDEQELYKNVEHNKVLVIDRKSFSKLLSIQNPYTSSDKKYSIKIGDSVIDELIKLPDKKDDKNVLVKTLTKDNINVSMKNLGNNLFGLKRLVTMEDLSFIRNCGTSNFNECNLKEYLQNGKFNSWGLLFPMGNNEYKICGDGFSITRKYHNFNTDNSSNIEYGKNNNDLYDYFLTVIPKNSQLKYQCPSWLGAIELTDEELKNAN